MASQKLIDAVKSLGSEKALEDLYSQEIVRLVRERYSMDAELAIQRQRDTKPDDFAAYFDFVEECKVIAHQEIYGDE